MIFDEDQIEALGRMYCGDNVFITGPAGTGKSSVTVEAVRQRLGDPGLHVCATTGVAAINLRDKLSTMFGEQVGATTLYRWAGIGLGPREGDGWHDFMKFLKSRKSMWFSTEIRIRQTTCLIIDEISMMPGKILDFIDYMCREIKNPRLPFGGIQVIAVGDFMQLPPVSRTGVYDWAFASRSWQAAKFVSISLRKVHRQDDPQFVSILNQFRSGIIREGSMRTLMSRVAVFPKSTLLRLMTHNVQVNKWNHMMLDTCSGEQIEFHATLEGTEAECKSLISSMTTPVHLILRRNARVMVTANLTNKDNSLSAANGEMGTVVDWEYGAFHSGGPCVWVKLDDGNVISIEQKTWHLDQRTTEACFTQIPLRLAWATTIHKSQGLTLDEALLDIRAAREPGQAYVAVSRVRSLSGLYLKDAFKGVSFSPQARDFHRMIEA